MWHQLPNHRAVGQASLPSFHHPNQSVCPVFLSVCLSVFFFFSFLRAAGVAKGAAGAVAGQARHVGGAPLRQRVTPREAKQAAVLCTPAIAAARPAVRRRRHKIVRAAEEHIIYVGQTRAWLHRIKDGCESSTR